jgi:hypothetical protein
MPRLFEVIYLCIFSSIIFSPAILCSQAESSSQAVVTFTIDFPDSQPEHYSIRVPSVGLSHYESSGRLSPDSDEKDSFDLDFALTPERRHKILDLAAKAGYFQKDLDSHHKGLAFTGKKTLTYKDVQRSGACTYNYSSNPAMQELTALMQNLSTTLEFGHRLQHDHRYQKLALEEELKGMENLAHNNELSDVSAIQSILDEIVADQAVMNVTRARAQRLLEHVSWR